MRAIIFFAVLLSPVFAFTQDKIVTLNGPVFNVKIIHVDQNYIYLYASEDSTKTVRQLQRKNISSYSYISAKDPQIRLNDSILFQKYIANGPSPEIAIIDYNESVIKYNPFVNSSLQEINIDYYARGLTQLSNSGTLLILSSVCIIGAGVMYVLSEQEPPNYTGANALKNFKDFNDRMKANRTAGNILMMGSGVFILSAGINLNTAAINMKRK